MRRNEGSVRRSDIWTAWDANTRWYHRPAKVRKLLRRIIKRQQKQQVRQYIRNHDEEDV